MAASTADYLIVAGHYPVWSVCENGPTANLVAELKPLLEKYQGHYISGHDHCVEYVDEGLGVQYHGGWRGLACVVRHAVRRVIGFCGQLRGLDTLVRTKLRTLATSLLAH
jgi:hypothetical protein